MARRRLLGDEQWATLFALPSGERDIVHASVAWTGAVALQARPM